MVKVLLIILMEKMVSLEYSTSLSSIRKNQEHIWRKSKLLRLKRKKSKRMKNRKIVTKSSKLTANHMIQIRNSVSLRMVPNKFTTE